MQLAVSWFYKTVEFWENAKNGRSRIISRLFAWLASSFDFF